MQRQPGANVIGVVDSIQKLLPQLTQTLPAGVTVRQMTDRTVTIRASVDDVEVELTLSIFLVVLVIFVFLRNVRATIISGVSVPLSLVGALGLMYLLGFSAQQPDADGYDHRHGLRGRRRHRDDREHLAPSRGGDAAARRRP